MQQTAPSKQIAPGVEVIKAEFPRGLSFNFSVLEPGDCFPVRAGRGKTARQNRDSLLGQASAWARQQDKDMHFRAGPQQQDGSYLIYACAGKRYYPGKKQQGIW